MLRRSGLRCDCCGKPAPDVVGPILHGLEGWGEFHLDNEYQGRKWEGVVLLCGRRPALSNHGEDMSCHGRMKAYISGRIPAGPVPQSFRGGRDEHPTWLDGQAPPNLHSQPETTAA